MTEIQDCDGGSLVLSGAQVPPALLYRQQRQAFTLKLHTYLQAITGYKTEKKLKGQKNAPPTQVSSLSGLSRSLTQLSCIHFVSQKLVTWR